jgi:hypothetical protein
MLSPKVTRLACLLCFLSSLTTSALQRPALILNAGLQKFREKSGSTQVFRLRAESLSDKPKKSMQHPQL